MRRVSALVVCAAVSACAPAQAATPEPEPTPTGTAAEAIEPAPASPPAMPGGYAPIGTLDQGMQAARAIAMAAIYAREPTRPAVENVEVSLQVVAGYNYAFAISLAGGARYHVTVFRSPQSAFSVTRLEKAD